MHIIFAITDPIKGFYQTFAEFIGQKDNVGLLASNVATEQDKLKDLIVQKYDSIKRMYG